MPDPSLRVTEETERICREADEHLAGQYVGTPAAEFAREYPEYVRRHWRGGSPQLSEQEEDTLP